MFVFLRCLLASELTDTNIPTVFSATAIATIWTCEAAAAALVAVVVGGISVCLLGSGEPCERGVHCH